MEWFKLVNLATGLEADMLVERLKSAGIDAVARGNDIVGIFGPGFQGATARGVDVFVPAPQVADARDVLSDFQSADADDASDLDR